MIDDTLVLRAERLRDELDSLRSELRARYRVPTRQVIAPNLKSQAATLAERWLVEIAPNSDVKNAVGGQLIADLTVEFQRLLSYSDQATIRRKYDTTLRTILRDYRNGVIIPLKQHRDQPVPIAKRGPFSPPQQAVFATGAAVFVGQSFLPQDRAVNEVIVGFLQAYGFAVVTGEKPRASAISRKVRDRLDGAAIFVGIFTRRDKIARKKEWTTSTWVIDEKAYAIAKTKTLILLKEEGVSNIGGLQGDYEYLEFDRSSIATLLIQLLQLIRNREPSAAV